MKNNGNSEKAIERKIIAARHFFPFFKDKTLSAIMPLDIKNYRLERKLALMSLEKNKNKKEAEINFGPVNFYVIIPI